jgi:hypothetical protein
MNIKNKMDRKMMGSGDIQPKPPIQEVPVE